MRVAATVRRGERHEPGLVPLLALLDELVTTFGRCVGQTRMERVVDVNDLQIIANVYEAILSPAGRARFAWLLVSSRHTIHELRSGVSCLWNDAHRSSSWLASSS